MVNNGFDSALVVAALKKRLGWEQFKYQNSNVVNSENILSESGRYFDRIHPLVTAKNVWDVHHDPTGSVSDFNALLVRMETEAIISALNAVLSEPSLIETGVLWDLFNEELQDEKIPAGENFCGWMIKVGKGDFAVKINSISLLFDQAATFKLYLYNNFRKEKLTEIEVTTVAGDQVLKVPAAEVVLRNLSGSNTGGTFFLGYFQDQTSGAKAIDPNIRKYCYNIFSAVPFEAAIVESSGFNRQSISSGTRTYGMNLNISAMKDYTNTILYNAQLFDELIGLSMAQMVIEQIINGIRSNDVERILKENGNLQKLYEELNMADPSDSVPRFPGVKRRLQAEIKKVQHSLEKKKTVIVTPAPDCE